MLRLQFHSSLPIAAMYDHRYSKLFGRRGRRASVFGHSYYGIVLEGWIWQDRGRMDETLPETQHHHSRRRRRRRMTVTVSSVLTAVIALFLTATHPGGQIVDSGVNAVQDGADAVQSAVESGGQTVLDAQPGMWHVAKAVDGDTLNVTMGKQKETVRLLGIDTPETHDPRKPVQCFGEAAAAHTKELLEGKNVRLEPDPTDTDRDKYGRLLRYVYLSDGTLVNAELVSDGYAFAYTVFPLTKLDDFVALEREARDNNRGLWAGCKVNDSDKIKQTAGAK
jgi:micrococcal nuclease